MAMQVHYLEIVTPDVQATCAAFSATHGVTFGDPDARLGNARTAALEGGWRVGVRAPMHVTEAPVVRPYWRVDDVRGAVAAAERAGATVAHPPLEIPGLGTFAIVILGGVHQGYWQV